MENPASLNKKFNHDLGVSSMIKADQPMNKYSRYLTSLLLGLLLIFLSACGGNSNSDAKPTNVDSDAGSGTQPSDIDSDSSTEDSGSKPSSADSDSSNEGSGSKPSVASDSSSSDTGTSPSEVPCNGVISDENIIVDTTLDKPCYKVPDGISVKNPAKLTILPGVKLVFAAGTALNVGEGASFSAIGTAEQRIILTAADPTPGYWEGIKFYSTISNRNQLDYVTVEYGVININTVSFPSSPTRISIKNTISRNASDLGVFFYNTSVVVDAFENNTLTLNDRPIALPSEMVGLLGADSRYSGNIDDRIHVENQDITSAQVWKNLGIPYYMLSSSSYDIEAALTLEAGVSLIFNSSSELLVKSAGSLTAAGSLEAPILFTGQEKTPGYWGGIQFYSSNSTNNLLDHVTVEYAGGGNPSKSANISSVCFPQSPTRFSVTNSVIKDSFGWGIFKYNTEQDGCFITQSNNTFINNASGDVNTPIK
jgi:hypothetical protein